MWLDEFLNGSGSTEALNLWDKLKGLVTEHTPMIRNMRKEATQKRVYNNIIIATNHNDPIPLSANDRRFNVAPSQTKPIKISIAEFDSIDAELPIFANYLMNYTVDEQKVKQVLLNEAREKMINISETTVEEFFRAVREGNLDYFIRWLKTANSITPDFTYMEFETAVNAGASLTRN